MTQNIACNDARLISSVDGVTIAMHDFGGTGSPVLLSHATGFHGHCWEPVAYALAEMLRRELVSAVEVGDLLLDLRGLLTASVATTVAAV